MNQEQIYPYGAVASSPASPPIPADEQALNLAITEHYRDLLEKTVNRLVKPGDIADALESGAILIRDRLVVMRLNARDDQIEVFADIGLPEPAYLVSTYRTLLEMNLCRTYPGITLGVHPESGRLVASITIHALMVVDEEVCMAILTNLASFVDEFRESRVIPLA